MLYQNLKKLFKKKYLQFQEKIEFSMKGFVADFFVILFGYFRNFILVEDEELCCNSMYIKRFPEIFNS